MRLSCLLAAVFPEWAALRLQAVTIDMQQIMVDLSSRRETARCPDCQRRSRRAHSRFIRQLRDLPLGGMPVRLRLHARRFRCLNPACARQTFRERLPEIAPSYQRRTPALRHALEAVSFALGGQGGARLAQHLRLGASGVSRNALLRLIRHATLPSVQEIAPHLRILGVDDFAIRRGMRYGALLVDLEQHRVIDLLPDREAATLARWLAQHTGKRLEVVSRDRGGAFAEGIRQGAPQARQVADRFHLLQNVGQALDRVLIREHRALRHVAKTLSETHSATDSARMSAAEKLAAATALPPLTCIEREHAAVEVRRQERYARVVALAKDGSSLREVARRAGVSRETVRAYLRAGQYRACAPHRRHHDCDAYATYLRQRWDAGERNSAALLAEIQAQGFTGAASTLCQYVANWRTGSPRPGQRRSGEDRTEAPPRQRHFSPRQVRWLLLRPLEELDQEEQAFRAALCEESTTIAIAQRIVADFGRLVRTRAHAELDAWLEDAAQSHIPELVGFVRGVRRDYDAVAAALTSVHSQGQVEGQVNRIKLLKRQTFGRAKFDLLRRRVLYHAV
jgi:transposase